MRAEISKHGVIKLIPHGETEEFALVNWIREIKGNPKINGRLNFELQIENDFVMKEINGDINN